MPPDWHYTHQTEMDIHPTIVMNAIPNGKTSAVMVEDWHSHMPPLMMSMKPSIEKKETMTMMKMMTKMKDGAEMAHEVADQKMRMHISMHAANDKPPTAMTVETSRPPCKVNQISGVMTVTPNTEPVMARPEMISAPLMAVPPQMMQPQMVQPQMVQPQMIQPMQSPIQQPVMMMPTNNAFPSNVMASRMDRRAWTNTHEIRACCSSWKN